MDEGADLSSFTRRADRRAITRCREETATRVSPAKIWMDGQQRASERSGRAVPLAAIQFGSAPIRKRDLSSLPTASLHRSVRRRSCVKIQ